MSSSLSASLGSSVSSLIGASSLIEASSLVEASSLIEMTSSLASGPPPSTITIQVVLSNLGPLTTTFTPAPSCSTQGFKAGIAPKDRAYAPKLQLDCDYEDWSEDGCFPTGTAEAPTSDYEANEYDGYANPTYHYYSPGLHCPEGWATVGAASREGDGRPTGEGVFKTQAPDATADYWFLPEHDAVAALMSRLEPSETAVLCCPSGYTADYEHGCLSTFPVSEFARSTLCQLDHPFDGPMTHSEFVGVFTSTTETVEYEYPAMTSGTWIDVITTSTVVLDASGQPVPAETPGYNDLEAGQVVGVRTEKYVILKHGGGGENNTEGEGEGEGDAEGEGEGEGGEAKGDDESAAAAAAPWAVVFGALVGAVIGAGLIAV